MTPIPDIAVPTAEDLRAVVDDLLPRFGAVADSDWDLPAHRLEWTCRETVAHLMDDCAYYALQLSGSRPPQDHYVELIEGPPMTEGGPELLIHPDPSTGTPGILEALDASAGLLCAVVATAPPERRGYHPRGLSDASGFAAMGITEAVLHAFDILTAHSIDYRADAEVCRRVLDRLFPDRIFPDASRTDDPWQDLLTAGGRTPETRDRRWTWDSTVRDHYGPA